MTTIYSIVSIDKQCLECQYVNAISYSKELLENMIQNIHPDDFKLVDFIIKENIHIYSLIVLNQQLLIGRSGDDDNITFNPDNLYAFNKVTTSGVENVLLDITKFDIENLKQICIFKNNISDNVIKFNVFYEEGIMNA